MPVSSRKTNLHHGCSRSLKQETKYKFYSEPKVVAQEIGLVVCPMKNGTYRLLKRWKTLYERFADKGTPLPSIAQCVTQVLI